MRFLVALAGLLLAPGLAMAAPVDRARDAYRFGFPVYQMVFTRQQAAARIPPGFNPVNFLFHRPTLADANAREVTTPNNDTLYSSAWLDLSAGPVELTMPALPRRYHSVALMSSFTDNFAVLGTRANGGRGGKFWIAGPGWAGEPPADVQLVRAPTNDVWLLVRVLVDGPADLAAARAAQQGFKLDGPKPDRPFAARATNATDPETFLAVVNEALARGAMPPAKARVARRLAKAGIGVPFAALKPAMQDAWRANIKAFYDELRTGLGHTGETVHGWSYPRPGIGTADADDLYRARVALGGLGALPREEAIYLSTGTLDGARDWVLRMPANVPVEAFWSLSMYEIAPDGRLFFTRNPIDRFALGDRTPGLKRNADGTIDIRISSRPPADTANWLPAPAGPFRLTFRGYLPGPALLGGTFRLPAVEESR